MPGDRVARRINSFGVINIMADVLLAKGVPEHIRSDNGAEMTAKIMRNWFAKLGAKTLYMRPAALGRMATASPSTASCATNA
jgi:hypothetical protein